MAGKEIQEFGEFIIIHALYLVFSLYPTSELTLSLVSLNQQGK
jgi:hypothetical protein